MGPWIRGGAAQRHPGPLTEPEICSGLGPGRGGSKPSAAHLDTAESREKLLVTRVSFWPRTPK